MYRNRTRRFSRVVLWAVLVGILLHSTALATLAHPTGLEPTQNSVLLQIDLNPLPDPWEAMKDIIKGIINDLKEGAAGIVDKFNWLVFSLPAPGDVLNPATWTAYPWEGDFAARWWNSVWGLYWGLAGVGTVGLAAVAVHHYSNRSTITGAQINYHDRTREAVQGFVLVAFGWVLLAVYIHGMNVLTVGVAPSGGEFLSSPGNTAKLGIGLILGAILIAVDAVIVAIGILILLAQWLLMLFVYAVFPAAIVARVSGSNYARVMSDTIIALLIGLPMLKFVQVLLLRFVFSLPLAADASALLTMLVTMAGVFLAFIVVPIEGTKRLLPNAVIAAGGSLRTSDSSTGRGGIDDPETAAAVSSQTTHLDQQIRVGPDSAARRAQPTARTVPSRNVTPSRSQPQTSDPTPSQIGPPSRPALSGAAALPRGAQPPTPASDATPPAQSATASNGQGDPAAEVVSPRVRPANGVGNGHPEPPRVTVNTAVKTNNTALAEAKASAESSSGSHGTGTGTTTGSRGMPSPWRPLRRAKNRVEKRRRNNKNDSD